MPDAHTPHEPQNNPRQKREREGAFIPVGFVELTLEREDFLVPMAEYLRPLAEHLRSLGLNGLADSVPVQRWMWRGLASERPSLLHSRRLGRLGVSASDPYRPPGETFDGYLLKGFAERAKAAAGCLRLASPMAIHEAMGLMAASI